MTRMMKKGLKDSSGTYCPVWYSHSTAYGTRGNEREVVVIYAREYHPGFSKEMYADLCATNNSDAMTDYFEKDRAVIEKNDPRFAEIVSRGLVRI